MTPHKKWTEAETEKLRELTTEAQYGIRTIPSKLWASIQTIYFPSRTVDAVRYKAMTLHSKQNTACEQTGASPSQAQQTPSGMKYWTEEEVAKLHELTAGTGQMPTDWWEEIQKEHFPHRTVGAVRFKLWDQRQKKEQAEIRQAYVQDKQNESVVGNQAASQQDGVQDPNVFQYLGKEGSESEDDSEADQMDVDANVATASNASLRRSQRSRTARRQVFRRYPRRARRTVTRYVPPRATGSQLRNGAVNQQSATAKFESLLQELRQCEVDSRTRFEVELKQARRSNPLGQPGAVEKLVDLEKNLRQTCDEFRAISENCMARINWEDDTTKSAVKAMETQLDALAAFVRPYKGGTQ